LIALHRKTAQAQVGHRGRDLAVFAVGQVVNLDAFLLRRLQERHGTGKGLGLGLVNPGVPAVVAIHLVIDHVAGIERHVVQQGFINIHHHRRRQAAEVAGREGQRVPAGIGQRHVELAGGIGEDLAIDQLVFDGGLGPEYGVELVVGRRRLLTACQQAQAGEDQGSHAEVSQGKGAWAAP